MILFKRFCNILIRRIYELSIRYCGFNAFFIYVYSGRGGWKFKPVQPQKNKMNMNILRQEKLIAQKKKEIEARMAEQAKMNAQTTSKPLPPM